MPELPEITALTCFLDKRLSGAQLTQLLLPSAFALKVADVPYESLIGRTVDSVCRQGKFLTFKIAPPVEALQGGDSTEPLYLIVSFAKAGWLWFSDEQPGNEATAAGGYFAAQLGFSNNGHEYGVTLTDEGTWKGLAIFIVRQPAEVHGIAELGPDPLDPGFGLDEFSRLFTKRQQIKGILKNQKLIAGIGNAYSDEILHAAKLSPVAAASSLEPDAVERLFTTMKRILEDAVQEFSGKSPSELKPAKNPPCACTAGLTSLARSAGTPCGKFPSWGLRCSTAPRARPMARSSPNAAAAATPDSRKARHNPVAGSLVLRFGDR